MFTPGVRLFADLVCWVALSVALFYYGYNLCGAVVVTFALWYFSKCVPVYLHYRKVVKMIKEAIKKEENE